MIGNGEGHTVRVVIGEERMALSDVRTIARYILDMLMARERSGNGVEIDSATDSQAPVEEPITEAEEVALTVGQQEAAS